MLQQRPVSRFKMKSLPHCNLGPVFAALGPVVDWVGGTRVTASGGVASLERLEPTAR